MKLPPKVILLIVSTELCVFLEINLSYNDGRDLTKGKVKVIESAMWERHEEPRHGLMVVIWPKQPHGNGVGGPLRC